MTGVRSGVDLQWVDPAIRPQDDLYGHVNGGWLRSAEIPEDRAQHGTLMMLRDRAEHDVRAILEDATRGDQADAAPDNSRIRDLYASFLDVEGVEARGIEPLGPLLDEIRDASDRRSVAELIGRRQREGLVGLFSVWVATDVHDSSRNLVHLWQAGLGLPGESYYTAAEHAEIRSHYQEHLVRLAALATLPDPEAVAAAAFGLETALAAAWSDLVSVRDPHRSDTVMTWTALREHAPDFDWVSWANGYGADETMVGEVVVGQPQFVAELGRLWRSGPLDHWKAWLALRLVSACAPYLNRDVAEADFDFSGRILSGTPHPPERWRRGVSLVNTLLGDAIGRQYVARHFPRSARDRALALVENLVEAYRDSLSTLDWMGPDTRSRALAKLDQLSVKIGYHERWKDYSCLEIHPDDLLGNIRRAGAWHTDRELAKIGRPVDRDEWLTTPQTVNAFYNPRRNEVVFPAAVLQPPLFDPDSDDAANYGAIGSTIGHEIGHGFDDQGAEYAGDGTLTNWWEPADRAAFDERARALVDQFNALSPAGLPEHTVDGALTLGENIGDLGGLAIAVRAYQQVAARSGAEPTVLEGLTGLQRLFFAYALMWRAKTRDAEAIRRLATDPHAPPDLRCNAVVTNLDAFHDAFHVTTSDTLYTPPSDRVRIW